MVVGDVTTAVDVLVLGAGPGGYVAAIRAAQLGRVVTIVEQGAPGGTCLNRGCIPLKALLTSSERYYQTRSSELATMGIATEAVSFDWATMQAWKQGVVDRLSEGVRRLLSGNRAELAHGTGWFINDREVRVEGEHGSLRFKFEHCVIATGADAASIPHLPYDGKEVLTPEQVLQLSTLPETLSVFGNDYIALELATLFARLGVKVKLYVPGEQLLAAVEPAALRLVQAGLRKLGVQVSMKATIAQINERPIVVSNGVVPRTDGLHLNDAGIKLSENGGIAVNSMQQSNLPHIYAVGDCTGGHALATIAIDQGKVAAQIALRPASPVRATGDTPRCAYNARTRYRWLHRRGGNPCRIQRRLRAFPLATNGQALTLGTIPGVALVVASADDGVLRVQPLLALAQVI